MHFRLPRNQDEWLREAEAANLSNKSFLSYRKKLRSASRVTKEQCILSRTICRPLRSRASFNPADHGLVAVMAEAKRIVAESKSFADYLAQVGTSNYETLGDFKSTLRYQSAILDQFFFSGDATPDETMINSGLLELLNAITELIPRKNDWWSPKRNSLLASFKPSHRFKAMTDGQLQNRGRAQATKALIECKKGRRYRHSPSVNMQEISQMVAWVMHQPDTDAAPEHKRTMVSGDGDQIFLSFFDYSQEWVNYLKNGAVGSMELANMVTYGAWEIKNAKHMREFAEMIVALCLVLGA